MPHRQEKRQLACAIVSDSPVEAELVKSLLEKDFPTILALCIDDTDGAPPMPDELAVLLLAFRELPAAEQYYRQHRERRGAAGGQLPQAVLLCSRDDVTQAYELCREYSISDYVPFWPVTHDPKRLLMAAHRACDIHEYGTVMLKALQPPEDRTGMSTMMFRSPAAQTERGPVAGACDREILVIDDDDFQQRVVASILSSEGYRTVSATSARMALELLESHRPSLILLDVEMPEINGIELLRLLKSEPRTATTPVVMLTGKGQKEVVVDASRGGAADFVVKPFQRETLLGKIARVLGTAA
jgi:CheY-like chemotaxis protein